MSEIVDAHVPQAEEEQTADAATHSSKLETYDPEKLQSWTRTAVFNQLSSKKGRDAL